MKMGVSTSPWGRWRVPARAAELEFVDMSVKEFN
jgi:hypothetical protein